MKDELIALELLKIQYKNETSIDKTSLFDDYEYFVEHIENKYLSNKIAKIKKIYKDLNTSKTWCDLESINMLSEIEKIINNEED